MNFNKASLAVLVGCSLSFSVAAATDDANKTNQIEPGKEKLKMNQARKVRSDSMYYVVLNDPSLANYQGDLLSFPATSISGVNNRVKNVTNKGVLDVHSSVSLQYKSYLQQKQNSVINQANSLLNRTLDVKHRYNIVLNAFATELTPTEAKILAKHGDVKTVEKIGLHYITSDTGPEFIGAKKVWSGVNDHQGTQGEGIVVGIIDTGINATHPSFADIGGDGFDHTNPLGKDNYLGDCQRFAKFCNDKLIGIISYPEIINIRPTIVNDNFEDIEDKVTIGYDFQGHGSHVASTAAGNVVKDVNFYLSVEDDQGPITGETDFQFSQISGVAPHANIVSYQVCDDQGSCYPELTVRSIEHAIENGVNVLNYSVGGGARSPWNSTDALAFLSARDAGLHIATSAGNSGPQASTIGAPGNAPWVTTVAAYTHSRSFSDITLDNFSGGENPPTQAIEGKSASKEYTGKIVLAEDYGDAGCLAPFAENTFAGEIVVCERGLIARVRKGLNVKEGGAGGLILMNVDEEANTLHADTHLLPAIHIDIDSGETLTNWLATGVDHMATINTSELIHDYSKADIAGIFTSRGPNLPYKNIFSPDIAAPGVDIYAAYAEDTPFTNDDNGVEFSMLSGTSMSSPHVAGALALMTATHPDWTPAEVQSAIMSTAHQVTYKDDDRDGITQRSDFFDQGAGSIRVHNAINAGLLLDISTEEYLIADPFEEGDPSLLNTTSIVKEKCIATCTWTRTVKAVEDSSWTADYNYLNPGFSISVSPSSFSLKAGEYQELTFTAEADIELQDEWVHGYVVLNNANNKMSDTHFQATIAFSAGKVIEEVSANINNVNNVIAITDITSSGSNDLQSQSFGLYKATSYTGNAIGSAEGPEQTSPTMNPDTLFTQQLVVKPYTKRLIVEITGTTAPDADLYVGLDMNNDGMVDTSEMNFGLVCLSGAIDSKERCVIETPRTGSYWIAVHNFSGTNAGEPDDISLEITSIPYNSNSTLEINSPTTVNKGETFDVELSVNGYLNDDDKVTPLVEGQTYYGLLELGSSAVFKRNIGSTLIKVVGGENQFINSPPQQDKEITDLELQLDSNSTVNISVDLTGVFTDTDNDLLTYRVEGLDGLRIEDMKLVGEINKEGIYTVLIIASDGTDEISTSFTISVESAPIPVPLPPEPSPNKSGGSLGGALLACLMLLIRLKQVTHLNKK